MKLDKELVREIMPAVEASDTVPIQWMTLDLPGRTLEETSYHVMLLDEAGLIEGQRLTTDGSFEWQPKRLTKTASWLDGCAYSKPRPSKVTIAACVPYRLIPIKAVAAEATGEGAPK